MLKKKKNNLKAAGKQNRTKPKAKDSKLKLLIVM